jgi:hypothetical protein
MNRPSKVAISGYVVLWIAIVVILSIAQERWLNPAGIIAPATVMFVGMVAFYPIVKWWQGGHPTKRPVNFKSWLLAMLVASTAITALQYIVDRW